MQFSGNASRDRDSANSVLKDIAPLIPPLLSSSTLELLYRIPLMQNICGQLPTSAAGGGWKIGFDGDVSNADDINKALIGYEHRICSVGSENRGENSPSQIGTPQSIASLFKTAQLEANIYRGAVILIIAEDGEPSDRPLNVDRLARVRRLVVINSNRILPVVHNTDDPSNPDFYQLILDNFTSMMVNQADQSRADGMIHHSRIIRFDGIKLPADGLIKNNGWGLSQIEAILPSYLRYIKAINASSKSVENHQLLIMKIKDLHDSIRRNQQSKLEQRVTFNKMVMDLMGAIAIDSENEDVSFVNTSFAGMDSIIQGDRDLLIGESNISHDRLFGESPSGLGATGDNERNNWSDTVSDFQSNDWQPKLRKLYHVIWCSKDGPTQGKAPDGWKIQFKKLVDRTIDETVQLQTAQGELDLKYLEKEVITLEEARSRLSSPDYEAGITLDDAAWKKKREKAEEAAEAAAAAPPLPPGAAPAAGKPGAPPPPAKQSPPGQNGKVPPAPAVAAAQPAAQPPPKAARKDAIAVGGFPGDYTTDVDGQLFQQATQEAVAKFRVINSTYAQAYIRSRYQQLATMARRDGEGGDYLVEIGEDGEILGGPCNSATSRTLPRSRAGRMSPAERLIATSSAMVR